MPYALTIGVPYETFWHLTPNDLRAFYKSYKQKEKLRDEEMWNVWGNYGLSALLCAIDRCIHGKKASSEYIKEPLLSKMFENEGLTEEEIYERELEKAIIAEEQWILASKQKGLPETII